MKKIFFSILFLTTVVLVYGQREIIKQPGSGQGRPGQVAQKDSSGFQQRDDLKDSITISYRYMEALRRYTLDSSVNDFDKYFPVPASYQYLGNNGSASFPLIFTPNAKAGWDAGFHAFDVYRYTLEGTKFYKTTR